MAQLIFRNSSASTDLEVADLGIFLEPNEDMDLIQNYRNEDLLESLDLETAMNGDGKVFLDGTTEFTYTVLIDYLTHLTKYDVIDYAYITSEDATTDITAAELEELTDGSDSSLHIHDSRYYTKTNMQTAGEAELHWDNITNTPSFGAVSWRSPVSAMLNGKGTTAQMGATSPQPGWFWWNIDDGHLYKYVSGSWADQGAPVDGDRMIWRDGTGSDDYIYEHDGTSWGTGMAPVDNWAVMVDDDGDSKPAQYVFDDDGAPPNWIKIADVDWYQANFITVTPSGDLSSTNVQTALEELQGDITNIINGTIDIDNSLDDAYNDGSDIIVDTTDVNWDLTDGRDFSIRSDSGATNILEVAAAASGDTITINASTVINGAYTFNGAGNSSVNTTNGNLTLSTSGTGDVIIASAGNTTFNDQYLTSAIPLSETGITSLPASMTSVSIMGALNEIWNESQSSNTLDEIYDGETGTRIVYQDNGTVEWQISDTYEHNFSDASGSDILSIRALAAGDLVRVNGNFDVNGGAITLDADAASNFTVDSADLTLSTVTSGDINITSAGQLDIDATSLDADFTGSFNIDGSGNSSIRTTASNLNISTQTSGDLSIISSGDLSLDDQYLTSPITLSETGENALDASYTAVSIIGALNELKDDLGSVTVTLDGAYDGPTGSGAGRTITADSGSVIIDASGQTNAPLQLTQQSSAPTTNLVAGQMAVIGGELYVYDGIRAKFLSLESHYSWGENAVKGRVMKIGNALGGTVGYKMPKDVTIVGVSVSERTGSNRTIHLRKNGLTSAIKTFALSSGSYTSINDNIDLSSGDVLQVFVTGGSGASCKDLVVNVYTKNRA